MSNVIEFPLTPLWSQKLNSEGLSQFVLDKTNIKEWISYLQNNYVPMETENDDCFLEDIQKTINEGGFVEISFERVN